MEREKDSAKLLEHIVERLDRYESLSGDSPKLSKKLKWSKTAADELRSQITAHLTLLQGFYLCLGQCAVLDALELVKANIEAGRTKCPSVAAISQASLREGEALNEEWVEVIENLEIHGITASLMRTHKDTILSSLECAIINRQLPFRTDGESVSSGSNYPIPTTHLHTFVRAWREDMSQRSELNSPPDPIDSFEMPSTMQDTTKWPLPRQEGVVDYFWIIQASSRRKLGMLESTNWLNRRGVLSECD